MAEVETTGKARMSIWVEQQDRDDMATIRSAFGLASDSAAIRYSLRQIARQARAEETGSAAPQSPTRRRRSA